MLESDLEPKLNSESDAFLNQVSLDYLINTKQYKIHLTNTINKKINKKDKKFYRRRIQSLTKELLSKEEEEEQTISLDVKYAFDNFIKTCIHYFKMLDKNDIIQEDYNEFDDEIKENVEISESSQFLKEENEKLLMRSVKMSNHSLDNFIKIKMTKKPEDLIIPQQKEINLKDPVLKNKGVIKKKNIINNYGEDTQKQTNEICEIQKDEK
jgi:vacuolar-type H+-ATPase catalytic subunit A/Vma1